MKESSSLSCRTSSGCIGRRSADADVRCSDIAIKRANAWRASLFTKSLRNLLLMLAKYSAIPEKRRAMEERADTGVRPYTIICETQ